MTFDLHKAKKAESAEPFRFTVDGEEFTFPPAGKMPWQAAAAMAEGSPRTVLTRLLSASDFARFEKLPIDVEELNALFEEYATTSGLSLGESSASAKS